MPTIPSVEADAPLVLIPGENVVATADLRPLIPKSAAGELLESIVAVTALEREPSGLTIDDAGDAVFDSSSISFWVDATSAAHGASYRITITFETRPADGPGDGSLDRTRKAVCPVVIRNRNL
jgi:hypothetical protein